MNDKEVTEGERSIFHYRTHIHSHMHSHARTDTTVCTCRVCWRTVRRIRVYCLYQVGDKEKKSNCQLRTHEHTHPHHRTSAKLHTRVILHTACTHTPTRTSPMTGTKQSSSTFTCYWELQIVIYKEKHWREESGTLLLALLVVVVDVVVVVVVVVVNYGGVGGSGLYIDHMLLLRLLLVLLCTIMLATCILINLLYFRFVVKVTFTI